VKSNVDASTRHRLLAVASRPSEFFEMAQLAGGLARLGNHVTLLYLHASSEPALHADIIARMRQREPAGDVEMVAVDFDRVREGRRYSRPMQLLDLARPQSVAAMAALMRQMPLRLWPHLPLTARRALLTTSLFERCIEFYSDTIRRYRTTAVLIPEDIVGPFWPVAVKAAHSNGVPAIVFPYTLADRKEALQSLRQDPLFQTASNVIGAELFPAWRWKGDDFDLVRLPEDQIFAHQRLGIAPPDPWMMNSGFADVICVDSEATFDFFRDGGIAPERMRVVGSASQDEMFRRLRERDAHRAGLERTYALSSTKPLLLVSGCPNQLGANAPSCVFSSMEELADAVGRTLAPLAQHFNLLVRPHPNYPGFGEMLERHGFVVARDNTAHLIPLADVFVAFASATIRWAIACGIPTVNYDVFNYGYTEFSEVAGVDTVNTLQAFESSCSQLALPARVTELHDRIRKESPRWAVMDGDSVSRIQVEIEKASRACAK
jgi:hypothetical protein